MTRAAIVAAAALSAVAFAPSRARADAAQDLQEAGDALVGGDYRRAAQIAADIVHRGPELDRSDRAEGWRIYGLALFMQGREDDAERALLEYLKLEPDAVLDPALVPPEGVRFFEDVRATHAEEIARYRPRPPRKRSVLLNLVPPLGQFQNGDRTKGWIIAGAGTVLIATSVTTYMMFNRWCDDATGVCEVDGEDKTSAARTVRAINTVSTGALLAVMAYGIWDGYSGYRDISRRERQEAARRWGIAVHPTPQGAVFTLGAQF